MSVTAYLTKRFNALRANDQPAAEALASIADGEIVRVEITRSSQRSLAHHRKFFALLSIVADQQGWTTDQCLEWTKLAAGHADAIHDRNGDVTFIPRSISFAKMDQKAFEEFFDRALNAIVERLLPEGTPRHSVVEEIEERAAMMSRRAA